MDWMQSLRCRGVDTALSNCNFVQRLMYAYYYAGTVYTYYMSDLLFLRLRAVSYMLYLAQSSVHGMAVKSKPLLTLGLL